MIVRLPGKISIYRYIYPVLIKNLRMTVIDFTVFDLGLCLSVFLCTTLKYIYIEFICKIWDSIFKPG